MLVALDALLELLQAANVPRFLVNKLFQQVGPHVAALKQALTAGGPRLEHVGDMMPRFLVNGLFQQVGLPACGIIWGSGLSV